MERSLVPGRFCRKSGHLIGGLLSFTREILGVAASDPRRPPIRNLMLCDARRVAIGRAFATSGDERRCLFDISTDIELHQS